MDFLKQNLKVTIVVFFFCMVSPLGGDPKFFLVPLLAISQKLKANSGYWIF
jgi:hypothetical protein